MNVDAAAAHIHIGKIADCRLPSSHHILEFPGADMDRFNIGRLSHAREPLALGIEKREASPVILRFEEPRRNLLKHIHRADIQGLGSGERL